MELDHDAEAFGLHWRSDVALDGFDACSGVIGSGAPIDVYRIDRLAHREGGRRINRGYVYDDGIRFAWNDEVAFDMVDGARIAYATRPGWTGAMPASFYSTVAALTAAWRGMVPLHASAVEIGGRAILVAGAAGAGKSTLTAGLVALGARFVADDLTVVVVGGDGRIGVTRGRPTIRLHPDTAARLDAIDVRPVAGDANGKWIARPRRRAASGLLPPGAIVLLVEGDAEPKVRVSGTELIGHAFRRRWLAMLPMHERLMSDLLTIGKSVPTLTYSVTRDVDAPSWRRLSEDLAKIVSKRACLNWPYWPDRNLPVATRDARIIS